MEAVEGSSQNEFNAKISALRRLLDHHGVDAVLLRRASSFAWATCGGASYVNTAASEGAASLLVTREQLFLATSVIEAPRLEQEEKLVDQGWTFQIAPWHTPTAALEKLTAGRTLISDVPYQGAAVAAAEIARLRAHLTPEEAGRFRVLGRLCAESMTAAVQQVRPGMSEYELAALLSGEAQKRGVLPVVNLVATDERAFLYRHPLPTGKKLQKYAMLVLSGRRWGLVCSITRLLHFGPPPADLQRRIEAAARVNAALVASTRPGVTLGEVLNTGIQAYAAGGYPDEWRRHHQGGIAGYEPRELLATPGSPERLSANQALAWNPSIAGAKMEDTILTDEQGFENLTPTPLWPVLPVEVNGQTVPCSLALEL